MGSSPIEANQGAPCQAARIMARFSNTGVAAGTAKRFQVFRMPAASATRDMKARYGHIQRVSTTAVSKPSGFCWRPAAIAQTSAGAAATPMTQVMISAQTSTVAIWSTIWRVASSPSFSRTPASTGTKAWLKAPSANRRRSRLGMRKATLKASVSALAPKVEATSSSRTRPVMREASVSSETREADLNRDTPPV